MRAMLSIGLAAICGATVLPARVSGDFHQATDGPVQPTPLEAAVQRPTSQITFSREIGRIDSQEAHAVVTAIRVEDPASPDHLLQGIRIDLTTFNGVDQVYLGSESLETISKALHTIDHEIDEFRQQRSTTPYRYRGAAEFWHPHPTVHTLNGAYYIAPDSSGLSLGAYQNQEFRFPGHTPAELASLLSRALKELEDR